MYTYVMRYSTSQYNTTQHITTAQHDIIKHINPLFRRNRTANVCASPHTKYPANSLCYQPKRVKDPTARYVGPHGYTDPKVLTPKASNAVSGYHPHPHRQNNIPHLRHRSSPSTPARGSPS